jgi:hypothetical protein
MNDYSHLRLHDTRVARATARPRPSAPPARARSTWRRLLHALRTADHPRAGITLDVRAPGPAATTGFGAAAHTNDRSVDIDGTGHGDAHADRSDAVGVS